MLDWRMALCQIGNEALPSWHNRLGLNRGRVLPTHWPSTIWCPPAGLAFQLLKPMLLAREMSSRIMK
jgi:hypothetical protein